jgi:hypothetical protein
MTTRTEMVEAIKAKITEAEHVLQREGSIHWAGRLLTLRECLAIVQEHRCEN